MKIKLSVRRIGGQTTDLLVTADASTTVGDLARVIRASDDAIGGDAGALGGLRLAADDGDAPILLDESALLTESPLASGAIVDFGGTAPTRPPRARGGVSLFVLEGPDAGKTFELATTHGTVGRQAGSTVALSDPRVSKHHADFDVIEGRLRIEDQNSANGIHVGARRLTRVDLADGEIVALADTVLQVRIDQSTGTPAVPVAGSVPFTRSPRVQPRYRGASLVAPSLPEEIDPPMFPWVALLAPVALGAVFLATGRSIESVLFFAASPLILGATFLSSRWLRRRREKRMRERFETRIARLEETLESERRREQEIRRAEAPATHDVIADALRLGPLLWSRRPEHWQFLMINLGSASLPSRTSVRIPDEETARQEVLDRVGALTSTFRDVAAVPVLESLPLAGSLGVVGPRAEAGALARGYLLQFAGLHSPAELVLTAVIGSSVWQSELDWIKWLPHVGSPYSPLRVDGLASGRDEADRVLAGIEELIVERGGTRSARGPLPDDAAAIHTGAEAGESVFGGPPSPLPAVVLVVSTDAPADRARLVQIAENGPEAGVFTIWLGEDPGEIPATARTFVRVDGGGSAQIGFVRQGTRVSDVRIEPVERATALEVARRLSPVVDIGALVLDESDLPAEIGLLDLLDPRATLTASQIGERWTENEAPLADGRRRDAGGLQARVGSTGRGPYALDIRRDGPHALVGGTSGSGKSEFLQSWVLSMAVERSPERLAFLFVDYKGGAAFQVFDRERLPHRAGIVTDLEGHLARRVLRYLGAEIERRERLFREKGVSGLAALEELGDPEAPPALVVIVDEYATVVDNIPDFEAGMVDIAQRGRALGIHLILATQQPSSVIKGALRANTNLRVALRVADAEDSVNVVGDRIAAGFDPALRGRAAVSTGPGRLDVFQTAYVGGTRAGGASPILLSEFGFAVDRRWRPTPAPAVESTDESAPSSDAVQLIALLKQAAAEYGIAEFRASWLDPLPSVIALDDLDDPSAVVRDARLPFGAIDIPGEPERGVLAFE
ncbi:FtsK/SpoIIIE domain-containing protein, partial [Pseudolysinimonas sp.]|uniref:FtsK/SpoIIIE domain-containing protein n=1 Tax=Pseudolysinimonas sp. TaxID=2680009 RepID=UPI00378333F0